MKWKDDHTALHEELDNADCNFPWQKPCSTKQRNTPHCLPPHWNKRAFVDQLNDAYNYFPLLDPPSATQKLSLTQNIKNTLDTAHELARKTPNTNIDLPKTRQQLRHTTSHRNHQS